MGASKDGLYNMAPFTWEAGRDGVRDVHIKKLKVDIDGKLYDEAAQCTVNFNAIDADIGALPPGVRQTRGLITLNGKEVPGVAAP